MKEVKEAKEINKGAKEVKEVKEKRKEAPKKAAKELLVGNKEVVVPGDVLAEGMQYLPGRGTYRSNAKIIAQRLGLADVDGKVIKIIPLSGKYIPKLNDRVIGKVTDILLTGWRLDINSPYTAVMTLKDATSEYIPRGADLTKYHRLGDYVVCRITNVTSQKLVDVAMRGPGLRKLRGGRIIFVNSRKVPRIIGKEGSMVMLIKNATGCQITVGQNGVIWLEGEPEKELIAVEAIRLIERESHIAGLTEKVSALLEKSLGKKISGESK